MISFEIERLIHFGVQNSLIDRLDVIPVRNALMELLHVTEPYSFDSAFSDAREGAELLGSATPILTRMLDYCFEKKLLVEDTPTQRELMSGKIMGILTPSQSEVVRTFYDNYSVSPSWATDKFYAYSQRINYIKTDEIAKNLYWNAGTEYGDLEITVNLSKPEKDPRDIAAAKNAPATNYPKCLLCVENIGFAGTRTHPARQNHRVIPFVLGGENWYFQYSPYVYYNEHCIVLNEQHVPMRLTRNTFNRLFEFLEMFPHYFIGSNADLPIVGGSILSHDHFQGGRHIFPMEVAALEERFTHTDFPNVDMALLKWPMSVIRISSASCIELVDAAMHILDAWRGYTDEEAGILASTVNSFGDEIPHNAVTPIARINAEGKFELDIVLRNNRTSDEYPLGVFHPHPETQHIKKENIGLIEVMGLAVLPGRLESEAAAIGRMLSGDMPYDSDTILPAELQSHKDWIQYLIGKYGAAMSRQEASKVLMDEIGVKFLQVLYDAGVYKRTGEGKRQFIRFMSGAGFQPYSYRGDI